MIIHGKERHFLMTVGASAEIAEYCPDRDLTRLGELFEQPYASQVRAIAKIVAALSRGYENSKKYEDSEYVVDALTVDEIMTLDTATYQELTTEALSAFMESTKTSVQTENSKKNAVNP